ncbi:MAG: vitamin B12 dependent-methionine synthase activation domain-containing protein [Bryobacterales bacterium]|nr:hypothetical protein [Bryobacteraceae bacterium]MDW8128956.1 vitamin B12 dependent-methionine synthase activation domain-containing protein [Bryobacterales bacterium]
MPHAVGRAEPEEVILEAPNLLPERSEVLRHMGYPADAPKPALILERVEQLLASLPGRVRPRALYRLYAVREAAPRRLELEGGAVFHGRIGEFLGQVDRVAAFVATGGPEIVALAEQAMRERDALGGLIYHAAGAALAEAMVERVIAELRGQLQPGEAVTLPYSPGYCGIPLEEQRVLFRLVDAERIGVQLLSSLMMRPLKTVSGLVGIGPADRIRAYGNPCDLCPLADCRMRR